MNDAYFLNPTSVARSLPITVTSPLTKMQKKQNNKIKQNINNNTKLITNHKNRANTFNNFFIDIPKQIDSNMVKTYRKYQDYLLNPVVHTFHLEVVYTFHLDPTNTEEVQSYINTLKNNKSTGPLIIPNKLFKQFKKPLSDPLTLLINLTFSDGKQISINS